MVVPGTGTRDYAALLLLLVGRIKPLGHRPLVVPLTQDTGGIAEELLLSRSGGTTAFLDGAYLALNEIKKAKNTKRALVIISDGGDNHSRYTETELKTVLQESEH